MINIRYLWQILGRVYQFVFEEVIKVSDNWTTGSAVTEFLVNFKFLEIFFICKVILILTHTWGENF